jgi:hypothetical protein
MDVRHHDSCGGLADSARRRTGHRARADRLPALAGRHGAYFAPHRCGGISKSSKQKAICVLRHRAAATAGDCRRPVQATATGARCERFQPGPGAFKIDYALRGARALARAGVPDRHHGAPGRNARGDCRFGICSGARPLRGTALRAGRAADALRSVARARPASMCCGPTAMCRTDRPST